MKLLEHTNELQTTKKIDILSVPEQLESPTPQNDSKEKNLIPAYFYSQKIPNDGSKKGFFKKIGLIIERIKSLIYSIRNVFGPFSFSKKDFLEQISLGHSKNSEPVENISIISEATQNQQIFDKNELKSEPEPIPVRPQILEVSQEQSPKFEQNSKSEPSFFGPIFDQLPAISELASQYSDAISTFFSSFSEKKPKKVLQYQSVMTNYELSWEKLLIREEILQEYRSDFALANGSQRAYPNHHPLERLYIPQLLPHTMGGEEIVDAKTLTSSTKQLVEDHITEGLTPEETLIAIAELRNIFLSFNIVSLKKVHTDLTNKAKDFFNNPSTKKRKLLPLEFSTLKKHFNEEIQITLEQESKNLEIYDLGREILWNWHKHHQTETVQDTKILLEYTLIYLKTVTILNNRYSTILDSLIKNLHATDKLEQKVQKFLEK